MHFVNAKCFRSLGFTNNGGRLVQEGNQISIFRVENISRKVILAKDEDVAGHPSYLVVDYLHHTRQARDSILLCSGEGLGSTTATAVTTNTFCAR